jgi:hypothetical protein
LLLQLSSSREATTISMPKAALDPANSSSFGKRPAYHSLGAACGRAANDTGEGEGIGDGGDIPILARRV